MDVNVLVFRRDMVQPPSKVGEVSDIIPMSEDAGTGVDFINGNIHVKFSITGTNQEFCDELKEKINSLIIMPDDPRYPALLAGTLIVTHEELQPYVVTSNA